MAEEKARSKVFIDNDRLRVSEWGFAPMAAVGRDRPSKARPYPGRPKDPVLPVMAQLAS